MGALVGHGRLGALRGDLGRAGAVVAVRAAHPVLGQELLQVHVLELEEAAVRRQGAIPQAQELVEASAVPTSSSTTITAVTADHSVAVPQGAHSQRVLVQVQSVFICRGHRNRI